MREPNSRTTIATARPICTLLLFKASSTIPVWAQMVPQGGGVVKRCPSGARAADPPALTRG